MSTVPVPPAENEATITLKLRKRKTCMNCLWWELLAYGISPRTEMLKIGQANHGECRKSRPIISCVGINGAITAFPVTLAQDRCGEFEQKGNPSELEKAFSFIQRRHCMKQVE